MFLYIGMNRVFVEQFIYISHVVTSKVVIENDKTQFIDLIVCNEKS